MAHTDLLPGMRVKDMALHLLDDDLGWLSRGRDGDLSGLISMDVDYRRFVDALNQKNQRWIDASQGFSPQLVQELLAWSGDQVAAYHDSLPLTEPAGVIWAGGDVPGWLGLGRDFTERWVHHQQIREAVGRHGDHHRYLPAVLSVFVWAFPHQYQPEAEEGSVVNLDFGTEARWHLLSARPRLGSRGGTSPVGQGRDHHQNGFRLAPADRSTDSRRSRDHNRTSAPRTPPA